MLDEIIVLANEWWTIRAVSFERIPRDSFTSACHKTHWRHPEFQIPIRSISIFEGGVNQRSSLSISGWKKRNSHPFENKIFTEWIGRRKRTQSNWLIQECLFLIERKRSHSFCAYFENNHLEVLMRITLVLWQLINFSIAQFVQLCTIRKLV